MDPASANRSAGTTGAVRPAPAGAIRRGWRLGLPRLVPGRDERPVALLPRWILAAPAAAFLLQLGIALQAPPPRAEAAALPAPPGPAIAALAAFGEPAALGKLLMLWLQAFDYRSGSRQPYRNLDYRRLAGWLDRIVTLDPDGQYALMSASRIYAEVPDPARQRIMLDFVRRRFSEDPNRRWPWLAHAAVIAKHELHDLPLALEYARALQASTTDRNVPVWVGQMEAFILEDMDELEQARILIGGILASGRLAYPQERVILERRLAEIERRLGKRSDGNSTEPSGK